jgi:hypothetical protein
MEATMKDQKTKLSAKDLKPTRGVVKTRIKAGLIPGKLEMPN